MFKKRSKFKVEIDHFYSLKYSEGDYTMDVEIDFREPVPCLSINVINFWNPPHENEMLVREKKEEILKNIYDFLIKDGFEKVEVVK